jgi:hypothetical protein
MTAYNIVLAQAKGACFQGPFHSLSTSFM